MRERVCDFSGEKIEPGTGIMLVKSDGTVLNFKDSKAEKSYKQGKDPRDVGWTKIARERRSEFDVQESPEDYPPLEPDRVESNLDYYSTLYEKFVESGSITSDDIDIFLDEIHEFKLPSEFEQDLVRLKRNLREGRFDDSIRLELAKRISKVMVAQLPSEHFEGEVDSEVFVEQILPTLEPTSEKS